MMHFLIFIPGPPSKKEDLANVGLPALVDGAFQVRMADGPTGTGGTLFGWRGIKGTLYIEFNPEQQTWIPSEPSEEQEAGAYWVGWKTASPPQPEDLQRAFPYRSLKVLLGDGHEWWIPAERELPFDLRFASGRKWELVPMQIFDEFCHCCREMRDLLSLAPDSRRDIFITELTEFARMGLSFNYRLCPEWESSAKLWNSEIWNGNKAEPLILDMIRSQA